MRLDIIEPVDKLTISLLESIIRIELIQAGSIDNTEQEITKFLCRMLFVVLFKFNLKF